MATLNLYHDRDDWPQRRGLILEGLRIAQPDLIALQEVLQAPGLLNQAQDLAEALGYQYVFVSLDADHLPRRYGNAILSRLPIVHYEQVALEPFDDHRSAGRARVRIEGRSLDFVVTHLHAGEVGGALRARQVRHLLGFIGSQAGDAAPTLWAGDFNAAGDSAELGPLQEHFEDAYLRIHPEAERVPAAHATLNPAYFERPNRVDHVYAQRDRFSVCHAGRILDSPNAAGTWPSDHFGVLVRLQFAGHAGEAGVELR